jgi:GTP cyclohydrolase I
MESINSKSQVVADSVKQILNVYDTASRDGLRDTPMRVARMYEELLTPQEFTLTCFPSEGYDEMVVETGIEFFSLCEHHMVPFFGTVSIGYIPGVSMVGISKLARTVEYFARRLQVQERMTIQIADYLYEKLMPRGIGVIITARHLCQEMRGIKKRNTSTITSALRGVLIGNTGAREEFLQLCKLT